jgi:hypothetical protein
MATALTATMGAGMATQLVQAAEVTPVQAATQAVEAMEKNPTGENIDKAYNAVVALEAGAEKDALYKRVEAVAAPHHKAVYDIMVTARANKDLKTIGDARTAVAGMAKIFINDAYTWSSELDTFTIEYQKTVVDTLNAIADGKEEVKQATINELKEIIVGLELQRSNEGLLKLVLDYSATLDKVQMDYVSEVVALVEKATTVDQIKVARAKYDDLMTMTNDALKAGLKADLGVKLEAKEAQLTAGVKLDSVKVLNLRQLEIKFNKEVKKSTVTLDNIYVDITNEETGSIDTNSLAMLATGAWELVTTDNQTFILQSTDGKMLTDIERGDNTSATLNLNEKFEVAARNVLDLNGKFGDTSAIVTLMEDAVRPTVSLAKSKVELVANKASVELKFSEPVRQNSIVTPATGVDAYEIYIDGNKQDLTALNITDVTTAGTVVEHSAIKLNDLDLEKGKHTIAVVGVRDLNGNLLANNGTTFTVEVVDPTTTTNPTEKLVVSGMTQVADNAFRIDTNFATLTAAQEQAIVDNTIVKEGAYNLQYKDIVLNSATTKYKVVDRVVGKDADGTDILNKSILVYLDAARNEATVNADTTLAYRGANAMNKKIVVKTAVDGLEKEYSTIVTFRKDTAAPVIKDAAKDVYANKTALDTISVKFTDDPFLTDGNGKIALGVNKKAVVKMTDEKGKTYSQEVTPVLGVDGVSIDLQLVGTTMLKDGKLISGATYTIVLEDGIVTDAEEVDGGNTFSILDEVHPFVGRTVTLQTAKDVVVEDINVPQTSKGMIVTGYEINENIGTLAAKINAAVGNADGLKSVANEEIFVVFDGKEIDAKTVTNRNNYLLNGKVLPEGATIEFREASIDGVAGNEQFALITLPKETVALTGGYDFTVRNIANIEGNRMLQVNDVVKLKDNTAAAITGVNVTASNTVEVVFSENISTTLVDAGVTAAEVAKNFVVTINGRQYEVVSAVKHDKYANKIILQTGENFELVGAKATVGMKLNSNGDMFVTDVEGNRCNVTK